MSSSRPTRTYGKGKARATSLPAREPSRSPLPTEAAPRTYSTRSSTVGRPVRTSLEYPVLASTLNLLGSYLDPAMPIDTAPGLPDRLMRAVVQAAPHILTAYGDYRVCCNADFMDYCLQVSHLFRRAAPDQFYSLLRSDEDEEWAWLVDILPTQRFQGFQGIGDAVLGVPAEVQASLAAEALHNEVDLEGDNAGGRYETGAVPGLYTIPTPPSPCSESHPFGIVPGWSPTMPPEILAFWARHVPARSFLESASAAGRAAGDADFVPPLSPSSTRQPSRRRRSNRANVSATPGPSSRRMGIMDRPGTVLSHSYLLPPLGVRPRVQSGKKKPSKIETYPQVMAPGELPIYQDGPLFRQAEALAELTLPVHRDAVPDWVRPSCGQCSHFGVKCTGGDMLNHVRCDQCAASKQPCGFDSRVPRFRASQHLYYAGEDSPLNIASLVSDVLHLRSMAQIAAAQADDLVRMTEAKLGTLSLILQRVYARRGDAGLNDYFQDVQGFSELLEFAGLVPLDTPMLFPRRLNATTIQPDEVEYRWSTDYEESRYFIPPEVSDEDVEMRSQSGSQEDFRAAQGSPVLPRTSTEPAQEE
ncbi:hypothetical protein EST38_g13625, partial [Candolleomyces aberdarensis]